MYKQIEKTERNKNRSVANAASQNKGDRKTSLGLVDNRPIQPLQFVIKNYTNINENNSVIESSNIQPLATDTCLSRTPNKFEKNVNPIQRFISKYSTSKRHELASEDQLQNLITQYLHIKGKGREAQIRQVIAELSAAPGWYSLNQVRCHLQKIEPDKIAFEHVFQEDIDRPLLPTGSSEKGIVDVTKRRQAIKNFSFTTVTTLVAQVVLSDGNSFNVELRNVSDLSNIPGSKYNRGHAEMILLRQIDSVLINNRTEPKKITITINNSPCEECTEDIICWAKKYKNSKIIIHYVNPYGTEPTTLDKMEESGISVFPFSVLDCIGSDTDDELSENDGQNISAKEKFLRYALKASEVQGKRKAVIPIKSGFQIESESSPFDESIEEEMPLKDVLHKSVLSEATRIGVDQCYDIGFADGTDNNCSIISIFKAADIDISSEGASIYRERLNINNDGDIDLTADVALNILNFVTEQTGKKYKLYVVYEGVPDEYHNPQHEVTEHADNGGSEPLFVFFAGTHFS
ncbi:hypothetical protein, partial [Candidatus Symbiopectobacterium sp. NZEC135]